MAKVKKKLLKKNMLNKNNSPFSRRTVPQKNKLVFIYCTFPNEDEAKSVARNLIDQKIIACANVLAPLESLYTWKGEFQQNHEIATIFKTTSKMYNKVEMAIKSLHSYECPCIIEIPVTNCSQPYINWLKDSIK